MRLNQQNDQQLIELYCQGNEAAFEELLNRHQQKVFSYIMMMVKDREMADDIFQETFFKVIRTLKSDRYNDEGKFLPWVMRIAHNLIIDHFRRGKKLPTVSQYVGGEDDEFDIFSVIHNGDLTVEEDIARNQVLRDVRKLVDLLPHEQRQVVIMRHYMDLSFKEIADVTDVSINTALGRMRYALINMRKMIGDNQMVMSW
jgi:RNA polymerase sigma-70 factor (ECF subfamily)